MVLTETFWSLGHSITRHNKEGSVTLGYRKFRAYFETTPLVCVSIWERLSNTRPQGSVPQHLLWALLHLKQYCIENINAALVGVTEKTFRKWSHIFIPLISNLPVVTVKKFF